MAPSARSSSISLVAPTAGRWGPVSLTLWRMLRPTLPDIPSPTATGVLGRRVETALQRDARSRTIRGRAVGILRPYAGALGCVLSSTGIAFAVQRHAQTADLEMIQLLGVLFVALRFDVRVTLVSSLVSVALFDFLFIPPRLAFAWSDIKSFITFAGIILVSAVISVLNERLRSQERLARETAARTKALYELHVDLTTTTQLPQLIAITQRHVEKLFASNAAVLLGTAHGSLDVSASTLGAAETELAERAWARRELATNTSVGGYNTWLPLVGIRDPLGAIGITSHGEFSEESDLGLLFASCANQLATAIERTQLAAVVHRAEVEAETERVRSSLLSAVSHDLKTPLATIVAAGTTLLDRAESLDRGESRELLSAMVLEAERLGRQIQNLLSVTRLEAPTVELRRSPEAVEEIIASAVARINASPATQKIHVSLNQDLPWVSAEPALIEQVISNLLENATRYSGPTSPIDVTAWEDSGFVTIQVADQGPGISEADIDKVFEKFYRGQQASRRDGGAGLGLTICRAIVRMHGGRIGVRNRQGGGAIVEFTLPVAGALEAPASDVEAHA